MKLLAKMRCDSIMETEERSVIRMTPVLSVDPSNPNHRWSRATPAGLLELSVTKSPAPMSFTPGAEYLVTVEPCPEGVS